MIIDQSNDIYNSYANIVATQRLIVNQLLQHLKFLYIPYSVHIQLKTSVFILKRIGRRFRLIHFRPQRHRVFQPHSVLDNILLYNYNIFNFIREITINLLHIYYITLKVQFV